MLLHGPELHFELCLFNRRDKITVALQFTPCNEPLYDTVDIKIHFVNDNCFLTYIIEKVLSKC